MSRPAFGARLADRLQDLSPRRVGHVVLVLVAAGVLARLVLAVSVSATFDLANVRHAGVVFDQWGLEFYGRLEDPIAWPYPPLYLAWATLATHAGSHFEAVARLLPIAADAALGWIVYRYLRQIDASPTRVIVSVALVAFAPMPMVTAGIEGQLDSVAILPAVVAALVWRAGSGRRAIWAGLLIGIGATVKTVPLLMLVPLLATVTSRREATLLCASALTVPIALLAPFVAVDGSHVLSALGYHGFPGGGGFNVVVQPDLANYSEKPLNGFSHLLQDINVLLVGGWVVVAGVILRRRRADPITGAALLWVGVFVLGVNWYPQYLNWGLPFFLMAGWTAWTGLVHLLLLPFFIAYVPPGWFGRLSLFTEDAAVWVSSLLVWLAWVVRSGIALWKPNASFLRPTEATSESKRSSGWRRAE